MRYFAYGSNMDPKQMAGRCAGARALGAALLHDHLLTFTWDSARWRGGVGDVKPSPGDEVWGVLWEITDEHARALDTYEMVHKDIYRRATVNVQLDGELDEAMIYLAQTSGYKAPSKRYVRALVRGAEAHGVPNEYVERLRRLVSD